MFLDFFFNNNVVEIIHKMPTLHIHIRGSYFIPSFSLCIL